MDGTSFLVAGYALTWSALAWYAWRLARRSREVGAALEARRSVDRRDPEPELEASG